MRTVGAYEAKTKLSQLLDEVAAGETIEITKHGKVVAVLTAPTNRPTLALPLMPGATNDAEYVLGQVSRSVN